MISKKDLDKQLPVYGFEKSNNFYFPLILYTEIKNPIEWASLKFELTDVIRPVLDKWNLRIESLFLMPNEIFYTDITIVLSSESTSHDLNRLLPEIKTGGLNSCRKFHCLQWASAKQPTCLKNFRSHIRKQKLMHFFR